MGWRPITSNSNNPILKWAETAKGAVIEGAFKGLRTINPKFGPVIDIMTASGLVTYGAPTVLKNVFADVPVGMAVRIEYGGQGATKSGKPVHLFEVSVPDDVQGVAPAVFQQAAAAAPALDQATYDALAAKFKAHQGAAGDAVLSALSTLYPDVATRYAKLQTAAASKGVA